MLSSRIEFLPDDVSILIDVLIVIAISDPVIGWSIGYPDVQYLIGRRSLLVLLEYWVLWCQRVYKALALIWLVRWANICKCKNRESFISKVLVVWLMENFVIVFDILGYGLFIWFRIYYQRLGGKRRHLGWETENISGILHKYCVSLWIFLSFWNQWDPMQLPKSIWAKKSAVFSYLGSHMWDNTKIQKNEKYWPKMKMKNFPFFGQKSIIHS